MVLLLLKQKKRSSVLRPSSNDNYASRFAGPKIYYSDETVVWWVPKNILE